ncbi:hypothetical protein [Saccharibacillus sp. JS10]|uniref:hypothetical protein n=1 Tax=Saccharibacillus sp. JS10 TaxID=2950552 RepID=UPI002108AA89|nr:hypothetical protein [Saccharibacillus sp. JS10]MCQ4088223.1 hypothetical protein [Saccharibacillus sp. JS10]
MRKFGLFFVAGAISLSLPFSTQAAATENKLSVQYDQQATASNKDSSATEQQLKLFSQSIDYKNAVRADGLNKEQIVKQNLEDGMNPQDAEYYAKLDILVNQFEASDLTFDYAKAKILSEEYVRSHPEEMKKGIFELNPDVWKTTLVYDYKARAQGEQDTIRIQNQNKEFLAKSSIAGEGSTITIKYPNGSRLTTTEKLEREAPIDPAELESNDSLSTQSITASSTGYSMTPRIAGPWSDASSYNLIEMLYSGIQSKSYESRWSQGSSNSTVINVLKFQIKNNGYATARQHWSTTFMSSTGDAGGNGIIAETRAPVSTYSTNTSGKVVFGPNQVLQGYTQARFESKAKFKADAQALGTEFAAGQLFSQYAIQEVDGTGFIANFVGVTN